MGIFLTDGDYRFRSDDNDVQFWGDEINHCTIPGCLEATVEIPGGLAEVDVTIDYTYDPLYHLMVQGPSFRIRTHTYVGVFREEPCGLRFNRGSGNHLTVDLKVTQIGYP